MNDVVDTNSNELAKIFAGAIYRADQWRQLNAYSRLWADATTGSKGATDMRVKCRHSLDAIARLEHCWAYPGPRLLDALRAALEGGEATVFARLARKVSDALLSSDYRRDEHVWEASAEGENRVLDAMPTDLEGGAAPKPYFEVLIVTPSDPSTWQRAKDEFRRLRRADDQFDYAVVHVGSFEDGALAAMLNTDIQAVVLVDGFQNT